MRIKLSLLTLIILSSCLEKKTDSKSKEIVPIVKSVSEIKENLIDKDSIEFLSVVKGLEKIQFYITGEDSVFVTKNIFNVNESNIPNIFYNLYSKSETSMNIFNSVIVSRKYHVKRIDKKTGNRPSANIIQLNFNSEKEASDWFSIYDNSTEKGMIQSKPKTELWLDKNHVYYIQTYRTPKRNYLNLLKETMIELINN